MNSETVQSLKILLFLCSPFLFSFLIVALLAPRFKAFAQKCGWTVQAHPKDHRDYLFKGMQKGIQWEMEYYIYDHYRPGSRSIKRIPYLQVIAWITDAQVLSEKSLLIYPRKNKLIHVAHPRLTVEPDNANQAKIEMWDKLLSDLPEQSVGNTEFQKQFVLRTDLEIIPDNLTKTLQIELSSWSEFQHVGPIILANDDGITIWWVPIGMRNEWLEKTVQLGLCLTRELQAAS